MHDYNNENETFFLFVLSEISNRDTLKTRNLILLKD